MDFFMILYMNIAPTPPRERADNLRWENFYAM